MRSASLVLAILMIACHYTSFQVNGENPHTKKLLIEDPVWFDPYVQYLVGPLFRFSSVMFNNLDGNRTNIITSPLSIHSALNLLLLGADRHSKTASELRKVLGYSRLSDSRISKVHESYAKLIDEFKEFTAYGIEEAKKDKKKPAKGKQDHERSRKGRHPILEIWNTVVTKGTSKILPEYSDLVKEYYRSSVEDVTEPKNRDQLYEKVNKWAKEAGFDNEVLSRAQLDNQFQLLLMSAVRVEASWFEEFFELELQDLFHNHGFHDMLKKGTGLIKNDFSGGFVEFTHANRTKFGDRFKEVSKDFPKLMKELGDFHFRVIHIPLVGKLTFEIIEPLMNGSGKELNMLKKQLLSIDPNDMQTKLERVFEVVDSTKTKINELRIPKFKFESNLQLKDRLKAIGLKRVFEASKSELGKITGSKVSVNEVEHQAVIEVHKGGIKAAGITKTFMLYASRESGAKEKIIINVSNPFMFVVRFRELPLFIGQLDHL